MPVGRSNYVVKFFYIFMLSLIAVSVPAEACKDLLIKVKNPSSLLIKYRDGDALPFVIFNGNLIFYCSHKDIIDFLNPSNFLNNGSGGERFDLKEKGKGLGVIQFKGLTHIDPTEHEKVAEKFESFFRSNKNFELESIKEFAPEPHIDYRDLFKDAVR